MREMIPRSRGLGDARETQSSAGAIAEDREEQLGEL